MLQREVADDSWYNPEEAQQSERLFVRFSMHPVLDEVRTHGGKLSDGTIVEAAGYPVHKEVEYIEIAVPGDKTNIIHRPLRDEDKRRFRQQYQAWKANPEGNQDGTVGFPLKDWPGISRAQVEDLKYFRVHTVEQLANLSDGNAANIGPIQDLKRKAQAFLQAAKAAAPLAKLEHELKARDNEIETLKRQREEQADRLASLEKRLGEQEKRHNR
jgi:hypothetical protein